MLGITKNNQKESTDFAGEEFVIYATCVCLAATFAAGCLGAVIGSPLLTFPLAMLISHPVIWIIMGVVLTTAYKLAKNYINGKRASQGEQKTQDGDSGIVPGSEPNSRNSSRRSSLDSGLGGKEFHEDLDTLVHQTNRNIVTG
ncbi:membrane-associated or secreted protein,Ulp1 protease family, C-terminal catalytic domain [Trichonephila clavata]|uniref:Membrane-associated or secreted protein,Ulp1 protease family, C-terminal catalytic domain n=1 Tax=Trichonephila clavata TaxID=2740835 RepID=A0A8X6LYD2_TRICU|nr:membrane-associated or secreted protein,Ulp1 protease family, C-terminal catalytic domain [Trichonephila clavata]